MGRLTKKAVIEERVKRVLKLQKELQEIEDAQQSLGYLILDKPIRNGWHRTFKLRDDILKSENANVYQEVLDAVSAEIWGREKKHADKNWIKYFKRFHYCYYQRAGIKYLDKKEYLKLSAKAKKQFHTFRIKQHYNYGTVYQCMLPKYYFQTCYKRAYITKLKITSSALERREDEICKALESAELCKYTKYYNYRSYIYWDSKKAKRRRVKMLLGNLDISGAEGFVLG